MVRPSIESLNSLAEILRQAEPLYSECHSILNYLDVCAPAVSPGPSRDANGSTGMASANRDAGSIHPTVLEPIANNHRKVM